MGVEDGATNTEEKVEVNPKKGRFSINKKLVMLKLTLFFLYGANSSLMPYLTVHMQSIGLTMEEIALIYLALPFTTFLAPPVTGFLVDKFGRYKPVVIISFLLTAAIHHSLLLLPHQETPGEMPSGYIMTHPRKGYIEVWWSPCKNRDCPNEEELDIVLDGCVDHCLLIKPELSGELIDPGETDDLEFHLGKNGTQNAMVFKLDMHPDLGEAPEQLGGIEMEEVSVGTVIDFKKNFPVKMLRKAGVNVSELEENDLRCGGLAIKWNNNTEQRLKVRADDCMLQKCNFRKGGPAVCPPNFKSSGEHVFWIYFVVRFLATVAMTAGVTIMDPIALTMIEKYGGDFGHEKLFSSIGMALFSPITGAFIDYNSKRLGYTDYSAAFYAYDILIVVSAFTVFLMPLGTKLPADNIFRDLVNIFKLPPVIVFIFFLFILGNLWGFIESFLFFYLKDLGAPNYLLGITVTVGTLSSLPFLYGADKITKKIGHVNIIIVAFFAHATRLIGYSFIRNAWWCFPFEALESLSVHLMWVAAATFCALLAPKHLLATLIGVIAMAHFSIGRGSGSFIGGHLIGRCGTRESFQLMGLVAFLSGIAYAIIHYSWLKKKLSKEEAAAENAETEKLKQEEPKYKDQSTMVSFERLSLMIEYNQIGSLTSLGRRLDDQRRDVRRGSYSIGMFNKSAQGSASKVDLLKSALEVNSRNSSSQLKVSSSHLNRFGANSSSRIYKESKTSSAPKLAQSPSLSPVVDKEMESALIPNEADELLYNKSEQSVEKKQSDDVDEKRNDS